MTKSNLEKHLHMVVCKNERQAKDLFERTRVYWESLCSSRSRTHLRVYPKILAIYDPIDAVVFIPERRMFDATSGHSHIRALLYNGGYVDRWLDGRARGDA